MTLQELRNEICLKFIKKGWENYQSGLCNDSNDKDIKEIVKNKLLIHPPYFYNSHCRNQKGINNEELKEKFLVDPQKYDLFILEHIKVILIKYLVFNGYTSMLIYFNHYGDLNQMRTYQVNNIEIISNL